MTASDDSSYEQLQGLVKKFIRALVARYRTQREFARAIDVDPARVSEWLHPERGEGRFGLEHAEKIQALIDERQADSRAPLPTAVTDDKGNDWPPLKLARALDRCVASRSRASEPATEDSQPDDERSNRVGRFAQLKGDLRMPPDWPAFPELHEELNALRNVDTRPLQSCLEEFGVPATVIDAIKLPMSQQQLAELESNFRICHDVIALAILGEEPEEGNEVAVTKAELPQITDAKRQSFLSMCRYQAYEDCWIRPDEAHTTDVIVVAGARGTGIEGRAHSARLAYQLADTSPVVILSGNRPWWADFDQRKDPTEEEMLFHYLAGEGTQEGLRIDPGRFDRDALATTNRDTARKVIEKIVTHPDLRPRLSPDSPQLSVVLVTGAYALRRFIYLTEREFAQEQPKLKFKIRGWPGQSDVFPSVIFSEADRDLRYKAIGRWLVEYFKLIGGRAAAQY